MSELTHFDQHGNVHMVDVGSKAITQRTAIVSGQITMEASTMELIQNGGFAKGDVLAVARLAGIMASKRTADLIPLCHPIAIDSVDVDLTKADATTLTVSATVASTGRTGVEMEAFTAVSVACLTVYDMCKSVDRSMKIGDIQLEHKSGGKSGDFRRAKN
jgi:cyclic pyranopterin phosphate synthase